MVSPGWYPDPSGLHERRYWDGSRWTEFGRDTNRRKTKEFGGWSATEYETGAIGVLDPPLTHRPVPFERRDFTDENPIVGADGLPTDQRREQRSALAPRSVIGRILGRLVMLILATGVAGAVPAGVLLALGYGRRPTIAVAAAVTVVAIVGGLAWLADSRTRAVSATGASVIRSPANAYQEWLLETLYELSVDAGIPTPALAVHDVDRIDVLATGPSRRRSLIVVTVGALQRLHHHEVAALLATGVGGVANGSATTVSLLQGVLNTLVVRPARLVSGVLSIPLWPARHLVRRLVSDLFRLAFGLPASLLLCAAGRRRDRRVDEASVELCGAFSVEAALTAVRDDEAGPDLPESLASLGLRSAPFGGPIARLTWPHTDVSLRIAGLE